jgi:hypothetical protein
MKLLIYEELHVGPMWAQMRVASASGIGHWCTGLAGIVLPRLWLD